MHTRVAAEARVAVPCHPRRPLTRASPLLPAVRSILPRLQGGESFSSHFLLSDQVYAKAEIKPDNRVRMGWLAAAA